MKAWRGEILAVPEDPALAGAGAIRHHRDGLLVVEDGLVVACGPYAELAGRFAEAEGPYSVQLGKALSRTAAAARPATLPARGPKPDAGDSFVEPDESDRLPVLMFGAGHVGKAIAARAEGLPLHFAWYDSRPEAAETMGVVLAGEDSMTACAGSAAGETAVVILTHDHALDYRLTAAALASPARFVGLIGSETKRARFLSRLEKDGIDHRRLTCPIGLPGLKGKEPETIAIATLAQLLSLRSPA